MMISSCSDDKDLPNVDITISFDNAVVDDGIVYAVQDDAFSITGITTKSVDSSNQSAIANVRYFWNGLPAPGLTFGQYPLEINVDEAGNNILGLDATLLETDKSLSYCSLRVPIKVVESADDLPNGAQLGEASLTFTTSRSSK